MPRPLKLDPDRLFPADPGTRSLARALYGEVAGLPIVSPHGHTDPAWFATDRPWSNATELLLAPDHYLYRMLYSQGVPLDRLGVPSRSGPAGADPREAWRLFASHFHLFRGTPSRLWLDHVFASVFEFDVALEAATAVFITTESTKPWQLPPSGRAHCSTLQHRVLATTEGLMRTSPTTPPSASPVAGGSSRPTARTRSSTRSMKTSAPRLPASAS